MYALPLTITFLSVIALADGGTLRQYGRDWLIPKPEPQVDSKRITAKSVFIAPSFGAENVRCAAGFRQDASGRCVKLVHVNQAAQLDFLLQRLNAMYGDPPVVSHSEKQPLQVTVEIPVESVNASTSMETEGIYSHVRPPAGEVSIDLLSSITADGLSPQPVLPESEENETDVVILPNKEMFQVDEEPIVMLTDLAMEDKDATQNSPLDSNKNTNFEDLFDDDEEKPVSVISEEAGLMAAISKNESNVIKKETLPESDSIQVINDSEINADLEATLQTNQTQLVLPNVDEASESEIYGNKSQTPSKTFANSEDAMKELSTGDIIIYNKVESDDKIRNKLHPENTNSKNESSSQVSDMGVAQEFTSALTSTEESVEPTTESTIANVTSTEHSPSSSSAQDETTLDTNVLAVTTGLPILETQDGFVELNEQKISANDDLIKEDTDQGVDVDTEYSDIASEYTFPDADVEVEAYDEDFGTESVNVGQSDSVPTEASAIQSMSLTANNRVENKSSEDSFDSASGDGDVSEHEYSGDLENVSVNLNQSVILNSTNTIHKTDSENNYNVPSKTGATFDEVLSFSEGSDRTPSKTYSHVSGVSASHVDSSSVKVDSEEVVKADSYVHITNNEPQNFPKKQQTGSEEVQQVVTSQHSVHVVYPQPIIQVVNVKQDSHGHTLDVANSNEPKTEPKETADLNSPPHQFHNLSPNPLQHHNSHPVSQVPLAAENVPVNPHHKFHSSPFPAQPPAHPYHPYQQFHPYPARPRPPHRDEQSGYVRFPTHHQGQEYHRSHPQAHAHRQEASGNAVRFPQEETRPNDKYSRWGAWGVNEEVGTETGTNTQQRFWSPADNRRNYWASNRPTRRRSQLSYY